jgi:hypothetical protein
MVMFTRRRVSEPITPTATPPVFKSNKLPRTTLPRITPLLKSNIAKCETREEIEELSFHVVSAVHAERIYGKGQRKEYFVSWLGFERSSDTWQKTLPEYWRAMWETEKRRSGENSTCTFDARPVEPESGLDESGLNEAGLNEAGLDESGLDVSRLDVLARMCMEDESGLDESRLDVLARMCMEDESGLDESRLDVLARMCLDCPVADYR